LIDDTKHKLLNVQGIEFEIIEERARDNSVVRVREIKRYQIIEALCEPRLYLLGFAFAMNCLQNGGLITFSTLLVNNLGFSVSLQKKTYNIKHLQILNFF
jgi:ACS family allantoate permease-like MFS transporter